MIRYKYGALIRMRKSLLFWSIYGVTWLILAASHFSLFFTHLGRSFSGSVKGSLYNCAPAALLGVAVILACKRFHGPKLGVTYSCQSICYCCHCFWFFG